MDIMINKGTTAVDNAFYSIEQMDDILEKVNGRINTLANFTIDYCKKSTISDELTTEMITLSNQLTNGTFDDVFRKIEEQKKHIKWLSIAVGGFITTNVALIVILLSYIF